MPVAARTREDERRRLLRAIAAEAAGICGWSGRTGIAPRVLEAIAAVPREAFVPPPEEPYAYDNIPLPIGCGQTISQPLIVAVMTDLVDPRPDDVVLEIGTGSGYQSAVLAHLVKRIYSVEIVAELATRAHERLTGLGYVNVAVRHADGYDGWPEHAPFDGILVTAAAGAVPPPLVAQLKNGRRLVMPLEDHWGNQDLIVLEKDAAGTATIRRTLPVAFVPLTRCAAGTAHHG